jgi:hypothetical protein
LHRHLFHRVRLLRAQRTIPNTPLYLSAFRAVDKNREYRACYHRKHGIADS